MARPQASPPQMNWTGETVSRFWQWQATHPDHYFTNRFGAQIAQALVPLLGECRTVLDYGCGPGFLVPHLLSRGFSVSATDQSPSALEAVTARCAGTAGFVSAEAPDIFVGKGRQFDAVIAIEVIEHMDDHGLENFFSNIQQLVSPEGIAVITTPNEENLEEASVYCPNCDHSFHRYQHMRSWSAETLSAAVADSGFIVERIYATDFSKRPFSDPVGACKRLAKALLGRPEKRPHLVCLARLPG